MLGYSAEQTVQVLCRYNACARGAVIKYREYLSVGKGRDVGFEQINGFEAKVAGETLTRDRRQ